jgi:hypothetical protein
LRSRFGEYVNKPLRGSKSVGRVASWNGRSQSLFCQVTGYLGPSSEMDATQKPGKKGLERPTLLRGKWHMGQYLRSAVGRPPPGPPCSGCCFLGGSVWVADTLWWYIHTPKLLFAAHKTPFLLVCKKGADPDLATTTSIRSFGPP